MRTIVTTLTRPDGATLAVTREPDASYRVWRGAVEAGIWPCPEAQFWTYEAAHARMQAEAARTPNEKKERHHARL